MWSIRIKFDRTEEQPNLNFLSFKNNLSISNLRPGDHSCLLYKTEHEHLSVVTQFLLNGLKSGEKVLYFYEIHSKAKIENYLTEKVDLRKFYQNGK